MTNKALANKIRKIFEEMAYNNCEKHLVYDGYTEIRCSMISVAFHDDSYDYEVCFYNYGNSIGATSLKYGAMNSRSTQFKTDKYVITVMLAEFMTRKEHFITMKREVETSEVEEIEEATEDYNEYEEILDSKKSTQSDRYNYLMETHSLPPTHDPTCKKVETSSIYGMFGQFPDKRYSYKEVDKVCGDCSHFNACMQGNQTVAPTCCMFDSLYMARKNPNWHHVSLATLANIDNDMLDEKRQNYMYLRTLLKDFRKYAFNIKKRDVYFDMVSHVIRDVQQMWFNNTISFTAYEYVMRHLQVVSVEKGYFDSRRESVFGFKETRRYKVTLR